MQKSIGEVFQKCKYYVGKNNDNNFDIVLYGNNRDAFLEEKKIFENETNDKNEKKDKKSKKGKNKNKKEKNKEQDKTDEKEKWKDKFIEQLLQSKYEVIIVNTFIHSLPDIRIELLKFVYQVHLRLILTKNTNNFNIFEKMIKTCLLPGTMFYYGNSPNNILQKTNNINSNFSNLKKIEPKKEFPKKLEPKKEEIKKFEPKKEEAKKIETKKEPPKKLQINKMFEPKKEDNTRLQTEPGGGRKNFLALLSKFDNPTSNNSNNDFKKSANIKQPNKIDKPTLNPSSNSSIKQANLNIKQNQEQKKITNEKEEFLKEQKKNLTKIKEEKPSIQENKLEKKNALFPSTNPIASNKPNLNIAKPNRRLGGTPRPTMRVICCLALVRQNGANYTLSQNQIQGQNLIFSIILVYIILITSVKSIQREE